MENRNKPIQEIRSGAVRAAIWANETARGVRYSMKLGRLYRMEDQWKSSESFGQEDCAHILLALMKAEAWIAMQKR